MKSGQTERRHRKREEGSFPRNLGKRKRAERGEGERERA